MPLRIMFDFGKNWRNYLEHTDVAANARYMEESLSSFIGSERIENASFLDIGCGSGLASLAAIRLGASKVVSVDVSANSILCTKELREKEGVPESRWIIREGSIIDSAFAESLPKSSVVYAWGVLHHTGNMHKAFEETCKKVAIGGVFHTAIYQRVLTSPLWHRIKRFYNSRGELGRTLLHGSWFAYNAFGRAIGLMHPFRRDRGMSVYYDAVDWLGGYPYEYATHDEIVKLVKSFGPFSLEKSTKIKGFGCNEYLFHHDHSR